MLDRVWSVLALVAIVLGFVAGFGQDPVWHVTAIEWFVAAIALNTLSLELPTRGGEA